MLEVQLKRIIKKHKLSTLVVDPTDHYFAHTTFAIHSLSDYIALVTYIRLTDHFLC